MKKIKLASFDVDPQNGFTPLCPNELPVPYGDKIVNELNNNASFSKIRVGSRDIHPAIASWNAKNSDEVLTPVEGLINVDVKWPIHCVHGTFGAELLKGLPHPIEGYDFMASKGLDSDSHPYGGCYTDLHNKQSTGVIEFLKLNNITHVIVGGLATEYCVMTTVMQLVDSGFNVIVNELACRGLDGHTNAIETMKKHDKITTVAHSDELEFHIKNNLLKTKRSPNL